ncbi:MAG: tetratricopeptide repeat protein, partial [Armatimonadetes bacterium]|nr:tetratricopeptide repeat protein [Armatimonadota bacterium]
MGTALAACKTITGGALANLLSTFVTSIGTIGWSAAASALNPATAGAVLLVAGLLGLSEASCGAAERKKAVNLLDRIDTLDRKQDSALYLLNRIADGEIGVTLDEFTKQDLVESIVAAMLEAGLTPTLPKDNFAEAGVIKNADFVGREEILADLHARLSEGDVALTHHLPGIDEGTPEPASAESGAQALRGEGGIGKTQIAIEYAHRYAGDYDGRWWLDASKEAIDVSAARLAATLGAPPGPQDTPKIIFAKVRAKLRDGRHLLILDNLDSAERLDEFMLPPPSRVLITTRLRTLPTARVNEVPISIFTPQDSIDLLSQHRTDLAGAEHDDDLRAVGEHLGHHALAVTLAASYLRKRSGTTPKELLERLQRVELGDREHLLEKLDPTEHTAGYRLSVVKSLSLHLPDFDDTPGIALLRTIAFCHTDDIPLDLLFDSVKLDKEEGEDWLVKLADVSIIGYARGKVGVHRLMQEIIRARLDEPARGAVLKALIDALADRFKDPEDYRNWAMQDRYAMHAESAVTHSERAGEIEQSGLVANQLGVYFHNRARYDAALAAFRTAERIDRAAHGDEHPTVAIRVNNIGSVLNAKGDLDGALKCFREAERIDRAAHGDEHPDVARDVNNIGSVLKAKGDLDGALKCFREAERIDRAAYGDDHPTVAIRVNNI